VYLELPGHRVGTVGAWRSLVSALHWGCRGRWFESSRPDQFLLANPVAPTNFFWRFFYARPRPSLGRDGPLYGATPHSYHVRVRKPLCTRTRPVRFAAEPGVVKWSGGRAACRDRARSPEMSAPGRRADRGPGAQGLRPSALLDRAQRQGRIQAGAAGKRLARECGFGLRVEQGCFQGSQGAETAGWRGAHPDRLRERLSLLRVGRRSSGQAFRPWFSTYEIVEVADTATSADVRAALPM
jgi:hypothetical protein